VSNSKISKFKVQKIFLKRMLCNKSKFCKTLPFWLLKIISLFNFLRTLETSYNAFMSKVVFPSKKTFSQKILVDLAKKMKEEYMLFKLKQFYNN